VPGRRKDRGGGKSSGVRGPRPADTGAGPRESGDQGRKGLHPDEREDGDERPRRVRRRRLHGQADAGPRGHGDGRVRGGERAGRRQELRSGQEPELLLCGPGVCGRGLYRGAGQRAGHRVQGGPVPHQRQRAEPCGTPDGRHDQDSGGQAVRRDPGRAYSGPQRDRAHRGGGAGHQSGVHAGRVHRHHPLPSHRRRGRARVRPRRGQKSNPYPE